MGRDAGQETVYVGARVPAGLAAAFEQVAVNEDRTISAELRRLIRRRVDEMMAPPQQQSVKGAKPA